MSYGNNYKQLRCYNEMVSQVIVERKVNYTHTDGKKKYFTVKHLTRICTDTKERERETD